MDTLTIITIVLGSSVVSSVITIILQTFLAARIEKANMEEIERLKAELSFQADTRSEAYNLRLEVFPELASHVYRCRNMARDLTHNAASSPPSLLAEFRERIEELIELLYKHRLVLETEGVFQKLHSYKNLLQAFNSSLTNALIGNDSETPGGQASELEEISRSIDVAYKRLISALKVGTNSGHE